MLMKVNILNLVLYVIVCVLADESDENDDRLIELLTNAGRVSQSREDNDIDLQPAVEDGLWKCGNCSDLIEEDVVHSEDITAGVRDTTRNKTDYVQVDTSITLEVMRCVVVITDLPTAVIRAHGSCGGPTVTLSFLQDRDEHTYTIKVYK